MTEMNTGLKVTEKHMPSDWNEALCDVKDSAILLTMATEYLCEKPILEKIGLALEKDTELLRSQVGDLKRRFVGKPAEDIDVASSLEEIDHLAKQLQKGDQEVTDRCLEGKLGKELVERIRSLASRMAALRDRAEGKLAAPPRPDSVAELWSRVKLAAYPLAILSKYSLRFIALFVLVCLMIFTYLFLTMEKERNLLEQIDYYKTEIHSKQMAILKIDEKMKRIRERIDGFTQQELTRQEKVELIELKLRTHRLTDEKEKVEVEKATQQQALKDYLGKLEQMRQKPFLDRLFRL